MYTRKYYCVETLINQHLSIEFEDKDKYSLSDFLSGEAHSFGNIIQSALDDVLSGRAEIIDFSGNMSACEGNAQEVEVYFNYMEEELGPSVFMPTNKLKELVDEWIEMEDKFKKGELEGKLPLVIED